MSSNLPPGVTEDMIPGNTPEDEAWDAYWDTDNPVDIWCDLYGFTIPKEADLYILYDDAELCPMFVERIDKDFESWLHPEPEHDECGGL